MLFCFLSSLTDLPYLPLIGIFRSSAYKVAVCSGQYLPVSVNFLVFCSCSRVCSVCLQQTQVSLPWAAPSCFVASVVRYLTVLEAWVPVLSLMLCCRSFINMSNARGVTISITVLNKYLLNLIRKLKGFVFVFTFPSHPFFLTEVCVSDPHLLIFLYLSLHGRFIVCLSLCLVLGP